MTKKQLNIIIILLGILILVFGYLNLRLVSTYQQKKESYIDFQKSSYEIFQIKRMRKRAKNTLKKLILIKKPKITKRINSTIYIFDNLNENELQRLLKKIKGSFLHIKTLEIKRDTTNHAMIAVEVLK